MMIILIALMMWKMCAGELSGEEKEEVKSLDEIKYLRIFGDFVVIVPKNNSETAGGDADEFEEYLRNHVVRVKSPLHEGRHFDFEMNDVIPQEEGRKKRKGIRDILLPILMALKLKATLLHVFMAMVALVAFKGFWAGMTGLIMSKVFTLLLLLQPHNKPLGEDEPEEEEHNEDDDHHSSAYVHFEVPHQKAYDRKGEISRPIVFHLNSSRQKPKLKRIFEKPLPEWKYWERQPNFSQKWGK